MENVKKLQATSRKCGTINKMQREGVEKCGTGNYEITFRKLYDINES